MFRGDLAATIVVLATLASAPGYWLLLALLGHGLIPA